MTAILASLLPALFPAMADGVRGIFAKLTGSKGAQPQNISEVIQLMQADISRLTALATLDAPGSNVHAWVSDIRALQRPVAVALVLAAYPADRLLHADRPCGAGLGGGGRRAVCADGHVLPVRGPLLRLHEVRQVNTPVLLAIASGAVQALLTIIVLKVDMRWLKAQFRQLAARVDLLEGRKAPLPSNLGD